MTTTARTSAEAIVWSIRENAMDTEAALDYCADICDDSSNDDENNLFFYFIDGSRVRFCDADESFSHDLEF